MHNYAGNPIFPITISVLDDADLTAPVASTFNAAYEGVADRTQYLFDALAPNAAKSWFSLVSNGDKLTACAWDSFGCRWVAVSNQINDTLCFSEDGGNSWATQAPGTSGVKLQSVAVDSSGNMVAGGTSATITTFAASSATWTTHALSIVSPSNTSVARDDTNGLWIVFSTTEFGGSTAGDVYTSPDRATWTTQSGVPSIFTAGDGVHTAQARHVGAGGGHAVLALMLNNKVYASGASTSAPGTWSALATITPGMSTPSVCSKPVYLPSTGAFLIAIGGTNGGVKCSEIWQSLDFGATWTKLVTLGGTTTPNAIELQSLAVLSPMVVGLSDDGHIAYSLDGGTTWSRARKVGAASATIRAFAAGDGGLMYVDTDGTNNNSQASVRTGAPNIGTIGT